MIDLKIQIPQDYLKEENRLNYRVGNEMKRVWAIELDLLAEFQRICDKYSINYIASGGTMLGAARHGGFIPWDDDIDLMMLREDYNKLLSVQHEFQNPYFLQTWENDKGFFRGFARLRNSNTTGIQKTEFNCKFSYNQGIFIDIFPMDAVVDDENLFRLQSQKANKFLKKALTYSSFKSRYYKDLDKNKRRKRNLIRNCFSIFMNDEKYLEKYEKECQRYNNLSTEKVSLLSFQFDNRVHDIPRKDLEDIIELDFEFLKIKVPKNYMEELSWKYGDWQTPTKSPSYHGDVYFDTFNPYTYYTES